MKDQQLVPAAQVRTIEVDDSIVLVDQRTGQYFGLNESGRDIWQLLVGGQPVDQIATRLAGLYDVDAGRASADIEQLVTQLMAAGLLRRQV